MSGESASWFRWVVNFPTAWLVAHMDVYNKDILRSRPCFVHPAEKEDSRFPMKVNCHF